MASLGHVAVGVAAARIRDPGHRPGWLSAIAWSLLSLLPDADVIGFSLGVKYEDPWGHRGATHSFAFAIIAGVAAASIGQLFRRSAVGRTSGSAPTTMGLVTTAVVATHPILDTMTDGGLGCALFWPFDLTRYFAPWRPIQVAPIGLAFLSPYGAIVAMSELLLFLPLFVFALRTPAFRRRTSGLIFVAWLVAAWLVASADRVREGTVAAILRDRTQYAAGFSEDRFSGVAEGQSQAHVRAQLGSPLEEGWMYPPPGESPANVSIADERGCGAVRFEGDRVSEAFPPSVCAERGIHAGQPKGDVERILGLPSDTCWEYSKGPKRRPYRLRLVCFHGATVEMVARRWVF